MNPVRLQRMANNQQMIRSKRRGSTVNLEAEVKWSLIGMNPVRLQEMIEYFADDLKQVPGFNSYIISSEVKWSLTG